MRGDIIQDGLGWFFRDNGDGTADSLSDKGGIDPTTAQKVATGTIEAPTWVLVRDGAITGDGDRLAARAALILARRYA